MRGPASSDIIPTSCIMPGGVGVNSKPKRVP
jgi:hypothetical protein